VDRSALPGAPLDGLAAHNPGWARFMSADTNQPFQYAVAAPLRLLDHEITLTQGLISEGLLGTNSHLGLAEDSTLLHALKEANLIRTRSWSLDAGSQSYLQPRNGSLVLGGYDAANIDGDFHFTHNIIAGGMVDNRACPLQITLADLTLTVEGLKGSVSWNYTDRAQKLTVCLEP
jgi:hypothetical protein